MQKEHTEPSVAEFLTARLRLCRKSNSEIATELGYEYPDIISLFASGKAKLPLNDIKKMAQALDTDPAYLLIVAMREYMPEALAVIENIIESPLLTHNERKLIETYRNITKSKDAAAVVCDAREIVALVMA